MQPRQGSEISMHSFPLCKKACTAKVVCCRQKRIVVQGRQDPSASGCLPQHLRRICGNSCSSKPDPSSWQPPVHCPFSVSESVGTCLFRTSRATSLYTFLRNDAMCGVVVVSANPNFNCEVHLLFLTRYSIH